jgi:hypothetical protein
MSKGDPNQLQGPINRLGGREVAPENLSNSTTRTIGTTSNITIFPTRAYFEYDFVG